MVPAVPPPVKPSPVRAYFGNIGRAVSSTFEGLTVTMSWLFRRPATIQYPDRTEQPVRDMLPESYRGLLEVDLSRCTACLLCAKTCPLGCISIETCKHPEGAREFRTFDIDVGLCMYCGLCAEACNFDALVHTSEFEASVATPEQLTLRFVDRPGRFVAKAKELPPRQPRGSILAALIPGFGRRRRRAEPPAGAAPTAPATPPTPTATPAAPAPAAATDQPERPEGTA